MDTNLQPDIFWNGWKAKSRISIEWGIIYGKVKTEGYCHMSAPNYALFDSWDLAGVKREGRGGLCIFSRHFSFNLPESMEVFSIISFNIERFPLPSVLLANINCASKFCLLGSRKNLHRYRYRYGTATRAIFEKVEHRYGEDTYIN